MVKKEKGKKDCITVYCDLHRGLVFNLREMRDPTEKYLPYVADKYVVSCVEYDGKFIYRPIIICDVKKLPELEENHSGVVENSLIDNYYDYGGCNPNN